MESKMKLQRGYLLIVAVVLIVIIGAIGSFLAYMFIGSTRSSTNVLQSKQAFYLATSGLELAKRDVLANSVSCTSINGATKYTNASLTGVNGQYTVTGSVNNVSLPLAGALNATATSIPLLNSLPLTGVITASSPLAGSVSASSTALTVINSSAFPTDGVVKIGDEYIGYSSKSGNILPNLVRGIAGTTAASHSAGSAATSGFFDSGAVSIDSELIAYNGISGSTLQNATRGAGGTSQTGHGNGKTVIQNQCILTATAGVPTLANPNATRVVQDVLPKIGSSSLGGLPGGVIPGMVAVGNVTLKATATVINSEASASANFIGSTIVTSGSSSVTFKSGANTKICNSAADFPCSSTELTESSTKSLIKDDVYTNFPNMDDSNLFNYYFGSTYDENVPISGATVYTPSQFRSNLSSVGGQAIWVTGNVVLKNSEEAGSAANPVLLIATGKVTLKNKAKLYGFVFADGNIVLKNSAELHGSMATLGSVNLNNSSKVEYNSTIIDALTVPGGGAGSSYLGSISPQERFK